MEQLKITVINLISGASATKLFDAILEDASNAETVCNALQQWMDSLSGWIGADLGKWYKMLYVSEKDGMTTAKVQGCDDIRIVSELVKIN